MGGTAISPQGDLAVIVSSPTWDPSVPKLFIVPKAIQPAKQDFVGTEPTTPGIITFRDGTGGDITFDDQGNLYIYSINVTHTGSGSQTADYMVDGIVLRKIAPDGNETILFSGFPDGGTGPRPYESARGGYTVAAHAGDLYFDFDRAIYKRSASRTDHTCGREGG